VHDVTALLQRCHLIVNVIGFVPFQFPFVADSVWPTVGVPVTTGGEVACGAQAPALPLLRPVAPDATSCSFAPAPALGVRLSRHPAPPRT
jgi:hypothetical protein